MDSATRIEVPFDVEGEGRATVVGHCHAPDRERARALPVPLWVVAAPGAGSSSRYFDMRIPGHGDAYSFAAFMNARGVGVVALDTFGVDPSSFPFGGAALTLERIAAAHDALARVVRERLVTGELLGGDDPRVERAVLCGVGHSAGAGATIVQQGAFASYNLVVALGMPVAGFDYPAGGVESVEGRISIDSRGLVVIPREGSEGDHPVTYGVAVPREIADHFAEHLPFPPSYPTMMVDGTLAPYAERITTPVFVGFGEIDFTKRALDDLSRFGRSTDVTVYVQPGAAHYHNAAPTRFELWATIYNWIWSRARDRSPT